MNKRKKYLSLVLAIVMVLSMATTVFAADAEEAPAAGPVIMTLQIDNPAMEVNGEKANIDENGTAPVLKDGRTLLPVRAVVEAMGGKVEWDQATKTATLTVGENAVKLTIDKTTAYLNDKEETLDVAPALINNRTMLPIRFVMESFGGQVGWNAKSKTVTLAYPAGNMPEDLKAFVDKELKMVEELGKALSGDWAAKYATLKAKNLESEAYMADPLYAELKKNLDDARTKYGAQYVYAVDQLSEKEYVLSVDGSAEPEAAFETNYGFEIQFKEAYEGKAAAARSAWDDGEGNPPCWSVFAPVLDKAGKVVCIVGIDYPCEVVEKYPEFNRDKEQWNGFED